MLGDLEGTPEPVEVKLFGLLPLVLGWGSGAELQKPLAIAAIGGLAVSTIVTLVLAPTMMLVAGERGRRLANG